MIHQLMLEILWLRWYGLAGMLYKHHQQEEESSASETGAAAPPAHGCNVLKVCTESDVAACRAEKYGLRSHEIIGCRHHKLMMLWWIHFGLFSKILACSEFLEYANEEE
jgi:hypothetical protein